jgi:prepilin-type N-terminal cleavage/methylation domain-containing protein
MAYLPEWGKFLLEATVKAESNTALRPPIKRSQRGFSLIEVMISMAILVIGLLSLLSVFGIAMAATQTSQENATAKQLANEALEGILTARETANIGWTQLNNTGSGGIFLPGFNPIWNPGLDGIIDTADDAASGFQTLELPGPNGIFANNCTPPTAGPDTCLPLTNFQRQVQILPVIPAGGGPPIATLRQVIITVQYTTPQLNFPKQYVLSTFISPYR